MDRYPHAAWEPVPYAGEAGTLSPSPSGWVLHVQDGNGDPGPWFASLVKPFRKFSHLWVSKGGAVKQFASLAGESWAQVDGDASWWSVETEGWPGDALTGAQLGALAQWHAWCGAPSLLASSPSGRGIGTHSMGGLAWGGHTGCPGSIRAGQRQEILRRAEILRGRPALARLLQVASPLLHGPDVASVQRSLGAVADGVYGPQTAATVRAWQGGHGLAADAVVGPVTWAALGRPA
jgi:hypothetical protein